MLNNGCIIKHTISYKYNVIHTNMVTAMTNMCTIWIRGNTQSGFVKHSQLSGILARNSLMFFQSPCSVNSLLSLPQQHFWQSRGFPVTLNYSNSRLRSDSNLSSSLSHSSAELRALLGGRMWAALTGPSVQHLRRKV